MRTSTAPAADSQACGSAGDSGCHAAGSGGRWRHCHHDLPSPFYDKTQTAFVQAENLRVGDILQTTTGLARITDLHPFHADTTTYDLTIDSLHTYYVVAGNTPVLVHNCDVLPEGVTVEKSESSIVINHSESGSMTIGLLDGDGKLTLGMDRLKGSPLSGKQMFQMVMDHFGDGVQSIEGNWSYGDNLAAFNDLVANGTPLKTAAGGTWTGQRAADYGFTSIRITRAVPAMEGGYERVSALFRRP